MRALIGLRAKANSRIASRQILHHALRIVGGAVVDHDDFPYHITLRQHALDGGADISGMVIERHHNGNPPCPGLWLLCWLAPEQTEQRQILRCARRRARPGGTRVTNGAGSGRTAN